MQSLDTLLQRYELVVGLEVHAQLQTQSKLFCGDATSFGADPNTHVSAISLAHPGTLPKLNAAAIEQAILLGLATNCKIERLNYFARKHYFYPDLPKAYQLSQHTTPICYEGWVKVQVDNQDVVIRLNRIHLEEDAGKSLHDQDPSKTYIDLNRAGVPLVEIVTEPDIRSAEEAFAYITELRRLVRWLGICDGNMEEGSMRCDANVSVRLRGETQLGTKVEVKNLNSIRNVKRAIEVEALRLMLCLENGDPIYQETRLYDANSNTTRTMRTKEDANDYRYFPDPDIAPFKVSDELLAKVTADLPELPEARTQRFIKNYQLPETDAKWLNEEKSWADYFEQVVHCGANPKATANWLIGPIKAITNELNCNINGLKLAPIRLFQLIQLVEQNLLNFGIASSKLLKLVLDEPQMDAAALAQQHQLLQTNDEDQLLKWVTEVLSQMPEKVAEYKKGKKGLLALFVGEVMKRSKGKADPKKTNSLILSQLQS